MKWEYWAVYFDHHDIGKALNEAGKQGWELVTGQWDYRNDEYPTYDAAFKRPILTTPADLADNITASIRDCLVSDAVDALRGAHANQDNTDPAA